VPAKVNYNNAALSGLQLIDSRLKNKINLALDNLQPGKENGLFDILENVNQKSLDFMVDRARKNLKESTYENATNPRERTGRLDAALANKGNHVVTAEGFLFMVASRLDGSPAPYWRAIEQGSRASVGRRIPLTFRAGNYSQYYQRYGPESDKRNDVPGRKPVYKDIRARYSGEGSDRKTRSKDAKAYLTKKKIPKSRRLQGEAQFVTVKRPIRAYRYGGKAVDAFNAGDKYRQLLRTAIRQIDRIGLPIPTGF
jgi:hypothetical protein